MSKHSDGQWRVVEGYHRSYEWFQAGVITQNDRGYQSIAQVAAIGDEATIPEALANARLIAAAPELLEACLQARAALPDAWFATRCGVPKEVIALLNAAIAKAEGKEPR